MKLSKYFNKILLDDKKTYAVFNSLLMDVIFVDGEELSKIVNFEFSDNSILYEKGIYVENDLIDEKALNSVKNEYNNLAGKIRVLYLCLTDICNFSCKYCYVNNSKEQKRQNVDMTFEVAKLSIDKWIEHCKIQKIDEKTLLFYGGEPLLKFSLIKKIVEYLKEKNEKVKYEIVTNGSLITEKIADFLNHNNFVIGISIDGPKSINDKNRIFNNGFGTFDIISKKIDILKEKKSNFGLSITLTEEIIENKEEVINWISKINLKGISYNLLQFTNDSDDWKSYCEKATKFLIYSYNKLSKIGIIEDTINRKIDSYYNNKFKFSNCAAIGFNQLTIKPNGEICVCQGCTKIDKYKIGEISTFDFNNIDSCQIEHWEKMSPILKEKCLSCPAIYMCGGGCPMEAEKLFGLSNSDDIPFCIHTKDSLTWLLNKSYDEME